MSSKTWQMGLWITGILAMLSGCGIAEKPAPHSRKSRTFSGWRLEERPYESINRKWAKAGDGRIPIGAIALVWTQVWRREKAMVGGLVDVRSACGHLPDIEYDGPREVQVSVPVLFRFRVSERGCGNHVVRVEALHPGVNILRISGIMLLEEGLNQYVLDSNSYGLVEFTSTLAGRRGVRLSVMRLGD